jgi:hypothetical protein
MSSRELRRTITLAAGAILCVAAHGMGQNAEAQQQPAPAPTIRWKQESWNPKPLPDDLVLPLPCGGGIAFRPVPTPLPTGMLSDRQTILGWSNPETDYSEFLRRTFVAGGFRGATDDAPPRFFMAKYEVTVDQYEAVVSGACAGLPTQNGRVPKANVAWHEAVAFFTKLSSWLYINARDQLPREGNATAFARLPTEDEWEYAARGGAAVSDSDFAAKTFPMPGGIARFVWFQGTRSAGGSAKPVGQLEANPLGLHDMLGNVAEWTLEPYRLNKVGRFHGLAGGTTARGGDYLTSEQRIRSALRVEMPAFNSTTGEAFRSPRIGIRPVLARDATTGDQQVREVQEAFLQESRSQASTAEDPLKLLEALRRDSADPAMQNGLNKIETTMRTTNRELREKDSLVVRGLMQTASHLGRQIMVELTLQDVVQQIADTQRKAIEGQQELIDAQDRLSQAMRDDTLRDTLQRQQASTRQTVKTYETIERSLQVYAKTLPDKIDALKTEYMRVITAAARAADRTQIANEGKVIIQEFEAQPRGFYLAGIARVVAAHVAAVAAGQTLTPGHIERDLVLVPTQPAGGQPRGQAETGRR